MEINSPILLKLLEDKTNYLELLQKIPILHFSYTNRLYTYFKSKSKETVNG